MKIDRLSGYGGSLTVLSGSAEQNKSQGADQTAVNQGKQEAVDTVSVSSQKSQSPERLAQIKEQVANNSYKVNSSKVAERLLRDLL